MTDALDPDPRRARVRMAAGAAVLLVLIGIGVAVLVALLGPSGATAVVDPDAGSTPTSAGGTRSTGGRSASPSAESAAGASLYVHVIGQVAHPGLYRLTPGARVVDAVAAAGGLTATAEAAGVNLARPLSDGEQLVVPAVGESVPAAGGGSAGAGGGSSGGAGAGGASGAATAPGGKVDLNTADQTALETLPRVGPALAQRILDWRAANGRFASVDDLRAVSGIGDKTFEQLKDLVTV